MKKGAPLKRTELRRNTPLRSSPRPFLASGARTGRKVRKESEKRTAQLAEYQSRRAAWLQGKRCAKCGTDKRLTLHHMRGRRGALLLDERWWLPLCGSGTTGCHGWVTEHPKAAIEQGYSLLRTGAAA